MTDRLYRGRACPHVFAVALVFVDAADVDELELTCPACGPVEIPAREDTRSDP